MEKEKLSEQNVEEIPEKKGFIVWVKEHKIQFLLVGVSVTTVIMTILGIKNKEAVSDLWESLKNRLIKNNAFESVKHKFRKRCFNYSYY